VVQTRPRACAAGGVDRQARKTGIHDAHPAVQGRDRRGGSADVADGRDAAFSVQPDLAVRAHRARAHDVKRIVEGLVTDLAGVGLLTQDVRAELQRVGTVDPDLSSHIQVGRRIEDGSAAGHVSTEGIVYGTVAVAVGLPTRVDVPDGGSHDVAYVVAGE